MTADNARFASALARARSAGRFLGQADPGRLGTDGEDPATAITPFELLPEFAYLAAGSSAEPASPPASQA